MPDPAHVEPRPTTHRRDGCRSRNARTHAPSQTEEHGRGLYMVDAVTTAWGLEEVPGDGKLVWAELARPG